MKKYMCDICGREYDRKEGFPVFAVTRGTPFEEVAEDFCCPVCSAARTRFWPEE